MIPHEKAQKQYHCFSTLHGFLSRFKAFCISIWQTLLAPQLWRCISYHETIGNWILLAFNPLQISHSYDHLSWCNSLINTREVLILTLQRLIALCMYFLTHPQGADQCIDAMMRKWPQVGMYCYYLHTIATTDILLLILTYYCYYWHITAATGILLLLLVYYWTIYWNISSYPVAQDSALFRICEEIFIFGETFTSVLTYFYCYYRYNSPMFPMIMGPGGAMYLVGNKIQQHAAGYWGVTTLFHINQH